MKARRNLAVATLVGAFGITLALPAFSQPRSGPSVESPEVNDSRKVSLRILAPKAESVSLIHSGDIPGIDFRRQPPLQKKDNGVWEITVGPLKPGAYRYQFNVDGVPTLDPRNRRTSESNSVTWSLVEVSGADWIDTRDVPHGAVAEVKYRSATLKQFRRLHVYTPPGYEAGTGKYPVFYLLHGAMDGDDSWSTVGRAGVILDNLITDGKARPMVVVMPNGHIGPFSFGGGAPMFGDFEKEFVADIMPLVEKRYRVHTDRANRAIAGLSMGGAHTLHIGIPNLDKFAHLGVWSSGLFGILPGGPGGDQAKGFLEKNEAILDDPKLKKGLKLFLFEIGDQDFLLETARATVKKLESHGFDVTYKETGGGHTWDNWRDYLREFAPKLFR